MLKYYAPQERGAKDINTITLRDLRISRGYTIEEVSSVTAVHCARVEQWENGVVIPSAVDVIRLSTVYGCSLQEIYCAIINTPVSDLSAPT